MNNFTLIPIIVVFIIITISCIILISDSKAKANWILFGILILSGMWITSSFLADHSLVKDQALFWARFAIIPPAFVLPLFLFFSTQFPIVTKEIGIKKLFLLFLPAFGYLIFFNTSLNIIDVTIEDWGVKFSAGILYTIFIPYFVVYMIYTFNNFLATFKISLTETKAQIKFVLLGFGMAFLIGVMTNVILPLIGYSKGSIIGPSIAILALSVFSAYAILKHHLFNIKVITSELLTYAIWIVLLFQFILSTSKKIALLNGTIFLLIVVFGILLMKSVVNEEKQRETLEKLTENLQRMNNKLDDSNKRKTQYLGFAAHQLRAPITVIKNISSLVLENTYGPLSEMMHEQIEIIFNSSNNGSKLIQDFLDVSKIEQGGMQYNMQELDIKELLQQTVLELTSLAVNKKIDLSFSNSENGSYKIKGDKIKLRQVFINLIDNSIKYTQIGYVKVKIEHFRNKFLISVLDTGIGIAKDKIDVLFQLFTRNDEQKLNSNGSGLGLFLAKKIIEAHKGKIWVESKGLNQGAKVNIELNNINSDPSF